MERADSNIQSSNNSHESSKITTYYRNSTRAETEVLPFQKPPVMKNMISKNSMEYPPITFANPPISQNQYAGNMIPPFNPMIGGMGGVSEDEKMIKYIYNLNKN